jgi:hypothetical protein
MDKYNFSLVLVILFLIVLFLALVFNDKISVIGKTIFSKKDISCEQGWICQDQKTSAYQKGNCEISYQVACLNICEDGMCK